MRDNTLFFPHKEKTQISFSNYIKEKYCFHKLFLPKHKPANDIISKDELNRLETLIKTRDHFEIRREIAKRYMEEN